MIASKIKSVFNSKPYTYWPSLVFGTLAFVIIGFYLYAASSLGIMYDSGCWNPPFESTWAAVSFLSMECGLFVITAFAVVPSLLFSFAYYVWSLNCRIKKLEKRLQVNKETV